MNYIYKLLDQKTTELLENDNLISLSRPFFAFKSESKGFKVFQTVFDRLKDNSNLDLLNNDEQLIKDTAEWICSYYDSLPEDLKNEYSPHDINSDLRILMTIFFQTYCGYFTRQNLDNETTRKKYTEENRSLCQGKNKYVKLSIEENDLDKFFWITYNNKYHFKCDACQESSDSSDNIRGVLHVHDVRYSTSEKLKQPFNSFNRIDDRRISSLLKYVNEHYCSQDEIRLMFRIPSYKPNESVVAFS